LSPEFGAKSYLKIKNKCGKIKYLKMTATNQSCIHERALNLRNAPLQGSSKYLSSHLLSKNKEISTYNI
jgi:hypothetical protein